MADSSGYNREDDDNFDEEEEVDETVYLTWLST